MFIDTFSGWTKAFPTKHETANVVAKKLVKEIMPRYGFPTMIGSDNGPAREQNCTGGKLEITLCILAPKPVKRMNRTLKETLTKLALETGADWLTLLPFALFWVRNSPYQLSLTPFKIMYGKLPPRYLVYSLI